MPADDLVSVIIPAYNCAPLLGAAISSCLTQTYPSVEVVVVNDGSTDDTGAIARAYGDRIVYVEQENRGLAGARNSGVRAANGRYLTLCDADDILMPDHIGRSVRLLQEAPGRHWATSASMMLTRRGIIHRQRSFYYGTPGPDQQLETLLATNFVAIFSTFSRAQYDEVGGFDEDFRMCEDWDFWLRSAIRGWSALYQREPTALYRVTPNSLSSRTDQMAAAHKRLLTKMVDGESGELTDEQLAMVRERLASPSYIDLVKSGRRAVADGQPGEGRRLLKQAAALNPYDPGLRWTRLSTYVPPKVTSSVRWLRKRVG